MTEFSRTPTPEEKKKIEDIIDNIDDLATSVQPISDYRGHKPVAPGSKIITPDFAPKDAVREVKPMHHKLDDVPVVWFSLAPVYQLCNITFSLPQEFINSDVSDPDSRILTYELDFPIFDGMEHDASTVEAIDPAHWDDFCRFLAQCGFKRSDGTVYTIMSKTMKVYDPKNKCFFDMVVFTPSTGTETCLAFEHEGRIRLSIVPLTIDEEVKDGKEPTG